jgi:hypothetical protein
VSVDSNNNNVPWKIHHGELYKFNWQISDVK